MASGPLPEISRSTIICFIDEAAPPCNNNLAYKCHLTTHSREVGEEQSCNYMLLSMQIYMAQRYRIEIKHIHDIEM